MQTANCFFIRNFKVDEDFLNLIRNGFAGDSFRKFHDYVKENKLDDEAFQAAQKTNHAVRDQSSSQVEQSEDVIAKAQKFDQGLQVYEKWNKAVQESKDLTVAISGFDADNHVKSMEEALRKARELDDESNKKLEAASDLQMMMEKHVLEMSKQIDDEDGVFYMFENTTEVLSKMLELSKSKDFYLAENLRLNDEYSIAYKLVFCVFVVV